MAMTLADSALGSADASHDGDLAATVLVLDGQPRYWRAPGLACDCAVTRWQAHALDAAHPDFACLLYRELPAQRRQLRR